MPDLLTDADVGISNVLSDVDVGITRPEPSRPAEYDYLPPLPPITAAQLAEDKTPLMQRPALELMAPEEAFGGIPRIPVLGEEGSRLRDATEFAGGVQESVLGGLQGMTTREGMLTYPLFAVPFVGPGLAAGLGAKTVGTGMGEVVTGAELHDPRIAASGFGQVLLGAPLLHAIELPRSTAAALETPAIDVETIPSPVGPLQPFLPSRVQPGERAGIAIPSVGEPMSRPGLPTQPKPPAPVVPETVAEARESVIEAIRRADARTLSQIQALFPEARLSREQARTFRNIAFPPVPEPVRPQATVAEVLGKPTEPLTLTSNIVPEPPPEPGATAVPEPTPEPTTEVPNAGQNVPTTEIHGNLRSFPVEGEGQMPAEEGVAGIQPRPEAQVAQVLLDPIGNALEFYSLPRLRALERSADPRIAAAKKYYGAKTIPDLARLANARFEEMAKPKPDAEPPLTPEEQAAAQRQLEEEVPAARAEEAPAKEPWQRRRKDYVESVSRAIKASGGVDVSGTHLAGEQHRLAVEDALREGKPVPSEVLADYPDLKPPPARAEEVAPEIKQGDTIRWEPNENERRNFGPVEGVVVDVISNTQGEKGYHILAPREGDPGNVVRVWENRGKVTLRERAKVEEKPVSETVKPAEEAGEPRAFRRPKTVVEIADEIAAQGIDPQASYGQFVKARDLKPEISAREWLPIYRQSLSLAKLKKEAEITRRTPPTATAATEAPVEKVVTKPINQITAEDLPELEAGAKPLYEKLEALGEKAFVGETRPGMYSAKYTPEAEAIDQQIEPYRKRIEVAKALKAEAEMKERNRQAIESRDKRIASAPVFQRRNGWEIVREGAQFAVRHPITKEEAYIGRLQRARQVADESRPEPPTAPKPAAPETPDSGRVRYRVLVTGETKRFQKVEGQWFREVGDKPTGKPLDPTIALTKALDAQLARESAPAPETPAVPPPGPPEPPREFGMAAGGGFGGRRFGLDMANLWQDIKALWQRRPIKRDMAQLADAMIDTIPANKGREAGTELRVLTKEKKGGRLIDNALARKAAVFVIQAKGDPAKLAGDLVKVKGNAEAEAAIKYAQENWDALQPLAERTKTILDEQINYERTNGIDTEYENHYVPQRHENIVTDRGVLFGETRSGTGSTGFKKAKVFPDYASAIEAGYIPRNLDIADLVEHRVRTGQRLVNRKLWADGFRTIDDPFSGEPIVTDMVARKIPRPDGTTDVQFSAPAGYVVKEIIPGVRIAVRQGYSHLFDALTETSQIRKSVVGRAGLAASGWLKHQLLLLDTFHASRTMQTSLAARGSTSYGKGISLLEYSDRALTDAVNHNLITPEMAAWVRTPQPFEIGGKTVHMTPREVAQLGQKNGLNVGRFADALYNEAKGIVGTNPFSRWLFEKLTRGAMVETFLSEFGRVAKANPTMNSTAVARKVARDINVLFGNLQRQGFIKNPAIRDMMQMVFLAPQWVESLARRELRAVGQTAQAGLGAATGKGLHVGTVAKTVGTGLAAYVALTQLLNYLSRGHSTLENQEGEHKLDAFIPDPTGQSDGFWFSPLSVFGEITHDLIRYSHTEPTAADIPQRIAENKLGPVGRSLKVMATGEDPFGTKLPTTWDRAKEAGLQLVPLPIGVQPIAQAVGKELGVEGMREPRPGALVRQAAGSLGFKIEPYKADEAKMKRARQVNTYIEYWKKQARQLPMEQRRIYIEKAMSDANLSPLERNKAKREFGEAGLFKYR